MFAGFMISKLAPGFVAALAVVTVARGQERVPAPASDAKAQVAKAADEWVKNNPAGRVEAQERPVPKDNRHPKVPPEQREKLGLPAPSWVAAHGKVQPAVREALEEQKRLMKDPKSMAEFQGDRPGGFQGTAYVDVYLRHEPKGKHTSKENQAAVKQVQTRILSKLTAGEFSLIFAFQNTAGLVGYVYEAGLAKLVDDPDVVAIGLDDQPRPADPPRAMHGQPGVVPGPRERRGNVEVAVYNVLEETSDGYVFVMVSLQQPQRDEPGSDADRAPAQRVYCRVLSDLTGAEFRVRARTRSFAYMDGYVNRAGLAKLANHPDVLAVGLNQAIRFPGTVKKDKR